MTSLTKIGTRILVLVAVLALPAALVAEVHCPSGGIRLRARPSTADSTWTVRALSII